ncbi:MAG: aminotransferase class I/II-fold pyridoxal phosphate-dependent enzyme [Pseudomonadota bacterium]|nr:aminotransferase class I/II-fold pyridoxal phosphate-dependent enzyme [Pseudomonadota bacterium]
MARRSSLLDYARRRFRLAGSQILEFSRPWFLEVDRLQSDVEKRGGRYTSFAHYDYLGLSRHPEVLKATAAALERYGSGASASRLVGGEYSVQRELETALAVFTGRGSVLALVSGYLTNVTLLAHLLGKGDLIMYDELSHNSISVGLSASRAVSRSFRHNDLDDLEGILFQERDRFERCLIVAESLYSMDGDLADLPRLVEIRKRHDCWLMLDEAHSIGTLGATGRGACEHFGVSPNAVDITVATLSKTFVSTGGFIAAAPEVIEWLRYTLPGFVYSVGLSPVAASTAAAALAILTSKPERVTRLQENSSRFLQAARRKNLNLGDATGCAIIPVLMADDDSVLAASDALLKKGIFVPPVLRIGVPHDKPRLRFFVRADHTDEEIDKALDIVAASIKTPASARP